MKLRGTFMRRQLVCASILAAIGQAAFGQVNISHTELVPSGNPGATPWVAGDAGLSGPTTMRVVVEQASTATTNFFFLDEQNNGFPGDVGTVSDDFEMFSGAAVVGDMITVNIDPTRYVALFHDVTDASGKFLSGPNGVRDADDAYLSSNPLLNITVLGKIQLVKYFIADPEVNYQYTSEWGEVVQLGSGYRAFIFLDDDHTPNFDYNDLVVGVLPNCTTNADCLDENPCTVGPFCVSGACTLPLPVDCSSQSESCVIVTCDPAGEDGNCELREPIADGTSCDDGLFCTVDDICTGEVCGGSDRDCSEEVAACGEGFCDEQIKACQVRPVADGTECPGVIACATNPTCQDGDCRDASQNFPCYDWFTFHACIRGPDRPISPPVICDCSDMNHDNHTDLRDLHLYWVSCGSW